MKTTQILQQTWSVTKMSNKPNLLSKIKRKSIVKVDDSLLKISFKMFILSYFHPNFITDH